MKRELTTEERAAILARLATKDSFESIAADYGLTRTEVSRLGFMALWRGELVISQ